MQHLSENISKESIQQFRKSLRKLERKLAEHLDGNSACCGVTVAQCHALLAIEEKKNTTVTELAAELELDKSTLSRTIEGLVALGLVNRETNSDNRRSQHIRLTSDGERAVAAIHVERNDFYASVFADIPKSKHSVVIEGLSLLANSLPSTAVCCVTDTNLQSKKEKKGNRKYEYRKGQDKG
jgi:DNA-binding MarR family transcriptional regulator